MSKQTAEVLRKARAKIEKPENWTQGQLARDPSGEPTSVSDPDAASWCLLGAVRSTQESPEVRISARLALEVAMGGWCDIAVFNDNHTHAEVLSVFDRAIAAEEASE